MNRLEELLLLWQERALDDAGLRELNTLLADPAARRRLTEVLAFDEELAEHFRIASAHSAVRRHADAFETWELREAAAEPATESSAGHRIVAALRRGWAAVRRLQRPLAGAAALLALLAVFRWNWRDTTIARASGDTRHLVVLRGAQSLTHPADGIALRAGDRLQTGSDATGTVVVAWADEPTLIQLHRDTHLALLPTEDRKHLELARGKVTISAAPQTPLRPLTIGTSNALATVLGTEFAMSVSSNGSRLEVAEGSVRLSRRTDEQSIVVPGGFQSVVGSGLELNVRPLLPEPWNSQDIGFTLWPGNARFDGRLCRVAGGGGVAPEWHRGREPFYFVYQTLDGDGEIRARLLEMDGPDRRLKAGIIVRASLQTGASTAFLRTTGTGALELLRRDRWDNRAAKQGEISLPCWLRLVRQDKTVTAYRSTDGVEWTRTGSVELNLGHRVHVGLGVTSGDKDKRSAALFEEVSVTPVRIP